MIALVQRPSTAQAQWLRRYLSAENVFAAKIFANWTSYPGEQEFFRLYSMQDEQGRIKGILSLLDRQAILFSPQELEAEQLDEVAEFLRVMGATDLLAERRTVKLLAQFFPEAARNGSAVMRLDGAQAAYPRSGRVEINTSLYEVYSLLKEAFDLPEAGRDAFYCDLSHRVRHWVYDVYNLKREGRLISTATVARVNRMRVISAVTTAREERGKGYSSEIMRTILARSRDKLLYVLPASYRLIPFYQRFGFVEVGGWGSLTFQQKEKEKEDVFKFDEKLLQAAKLAEEAVSQQFERIERIAEYNQQKVLKAFIDQRVSEAHLGGTTGYGYGDIGREALDAVFAQITGSEDALVRFNFLSGTHALTVALFGVLRPGDLLVSLTGRPYDTLEEVIGLSGEGCGSLREFGVQYAEVGLLPNGAPDLEEIGQRVKGAKVAYIQRSRGYSLRPALTVEQIGRIIERVRAVNPSAIVMVDNCYGEFVEYNEPTEVGADLIIGSLIKNPGGGIARTGGYIAGKKALIEQCAYRLTTPGTGKEVGCTLGENKSMFMGLFFAPHVVSQAMKSAVFAASLFGSMGFEIYPKADEMRSDIIQAIRFGDEKKLIAFCQGIQSGSPIDSYALPEPWDMPGYDSQVIMAAGAFHMGASIELSADAPLREPYAAYLQGGLTYESAKTGILLAAQRLLDQNLLVL